MRNAAGLSIELLDNGSIHAIRRGAILINQVLGSPVEGGLGNLWVRRRTRAGISARPLIGPAAAGTFRASADGAIWEGEIDGLASSCTLRLAPRRAAWFWTVRLTNVSRRRLSVDGVLAQDLGIAEEGAVRASELYTSQYIDHTVLEDDAFGFLICSRQNLPQGGVFPWVIHGCLDGAVGYLTDGFQLYGLDYKATNAPIALGRRRLPNRNYQYEFALPTLQSRALSLPPGATGELTFFATFERDHPAASSAADAPRARVAADASRGLRRRRPVAGPAHPRPRGLFDAPVLFRSDDLGPADLERFFGSDRRHVERHDGTLWSFFHGRQQHVVLKAKELAVERPTGHIMRSGRDVLPSDDILSVTAWMFGVFGSHLTIGNTSFNKLLGVFRNPLNVLKSSGQRIAVRTERGDELLGVPSAFEMGPNGARWIYRDGRFTLSVWLTTSLDAPVCRLDIDVERGGPLRFIISDSVVVGANEGDAMPRVAVDPATRFVELRPAPEALVSRHYPETTFVIAPADPGQVEAIGGGGLLREDGADPGAPFVVVRTKPVTRFSLVFTGSVLDAARAHRLATAAVGAGDRPEPDPDEAVDALWSSVGRRAVLGGAIGRTADDVARLNDLVPWYLHNAMVHFTTP
ncbi:MAG TPA: hypothetical protein VFO73_15185, partial [Candidatus Limnocylindrales bacterium]|nr:hypothetical protein [Candidatus Limnocylindrales bacterium]